MDHTHVLALVAALSGSPDTGAYSRLRQASLLPGSAVTLTPCPRPLPTAEIEGVTVICGTVDVPEDRAKIDGRKLALAFAVLRASSKFPEPDPVVYLEGGPGGSAVKGIALFERIFRPWRDRRDIVMFDQRSAGISGSSVNCFKALSDNVLAIAKPNDPAAISGMADPALLKKCVAELEQQKLPLPVYNTTQNAMDVQAVVNALGYQTYNIYGISYGTKLALEVMRVAPAGVRSVIIDGVAPSWVRLYDSLALKNDEAIQHVVDQCAADKACNDAYPDLGRIFNETLAKAAAGEIMFRGEKAPVELVMMPVLMRNGKYDSSPVTKYIPAYVYELWRGKEMPTVELLVEAKFDTPKPRDEDVMKAASKLNREQQDFVRQILDNLAISARAEQSLGRAISALRNSIESSRIIGPVARMFDDELASAMIETLRGDKSRLQDVMADYTSMQTAQPSKERLQAFVTAHFSGASRDRLVSLIASMNPVEVAGSFSIIRRDSYTGFSKFLSGLYLDVYACQEDRPFNSPEGYKQINATLRYPKAASMTDTLAKLFHASCDAFKAQPRENWLVPVVSDIPTLSFGSLFDTQTPASWARTAIERLTNAQAFMIPEAGHGALIYQPCVSEMGVAFIDNPRRKFDNSCAESIRVDWHIAAWVAKEKK